MNSAVNDREAVVCFLISKLVGCSWAIARNACFRINRVVC